MPYLAFMLSMMSLIPYVGYQFDEPIVSFDYDVYRETHSKLGFMMKIISCLILWTYFILFEVKQLKELKQFYWKESKNQLEIVSAILDLTIIFKFLFDYYRGSVLMESQFFVGMYSIAIFILWVRQFYMMRIFAGTAHFITLINQVISDISVFTIMLLICICGFGSFFWALSRSEPKD